MRLALFALTGFGNIVLKSFLNQGVKPLVLITRKEKNKFPYYKLENISSLARRNKIKVEYDKTFIKNKNVDLLISQIKEHKPKSVAVVDELAAKKIIMSMKNCMKT